MRHRRHYSLDEARALLPWVAEQLATLRDARDRLTDTEKREELIRARPATAASDPGKRVGDASSSCSRGPRASPSARSSARPDRGLVDFPSLRDGREVYLCWDDGEPDIGFWHELDAGYPGREEL